MFKRLILAFLAALSFTAMAFGADNFATFRVENRLSISIPSHWTVLDESTRRDIAAAAQAMINEETHVSSLSVHAPPEPSGAIIRVQFVDSDGLDQSELIGAIRSDPAGSMRELQIASEEEIGKLARAVAPNGIKILGPPKTTVEAINGKLAIAVQYRRTGFAPGTTFNVTQYHIPLGPDKALVTLSYREQDGLLYSVILKRVKESITIR